jgi:transcriptional regulator with XRE-family HTH domain
MEQVDVAGQFGQNLRRLRHRVGISQEELALRASLNRTAIGLLEQGQRRGRVDTVVKLAGGLEMEVGALFDGLLWLPGYGGAGHFVPVRSVPRS